MKKSLTLTMLALLAISTTSTAALSADNKVTCGCKKIGTAIVYPFKKLGAGMKAVGKKVTGK